MWRATMIAALAVFLVACGGSNGSESTGGIRTDATPVTTEAVETPSEAASDAFERLIGYISKGQYGRAWDELHPAQHVIWTRARTRVGKLNAEFQKPPSWRYRWTPRSASSAHTRYVSS